MISISFLYLGLLVIALIGHHAKKIIAGIEAENDSCLECLKYASLLEGIEISFLIDENVTLELSDYEYHLRKEDVSQYLTKFPNISLNFHASNE